MHSLRLSPKSVLRSVVFTLFLAISFSGLTFASRIANTNEANYPPAPDFSLPGLSGQKSLSEYQGSYLYVDFWASWCGPCRQSFPWMNAMQGKYDTNGLKIIAINLDENRIDAERFLEDVRADIDIAFDQHGDTAEAFNVKGMPSSYLINPDGEIVFSHVGFRKRDSARLEIEIAKVMGGDE